MLVVLSACGSLPTPEETGTEVRYDYSLNVTITETSTVEEVEAQHGGTVVVWRLEAGFAILGLYNEELSTLSLDAETNQNAISTPEVTAGAGGMSAWSGGVSAWSGGMSAWSGGSSTAFPNNADEWDQINLPEARALAPRLGQGVKVAVIDTGIDLDHPVFEGRLAPQSEWRDWVDGDVLPGEKMDASGNNAAYGHGTGVAGVVFQMAPNATILPLRVLRPNGAGDVTDVAAAID